MADYIAAGYVAPGLGSVRTEFFKVVAAEPGLGAQLVAYHGDRMVVDLAAGMDHDDLTGLYSSAKGAAHLVVALLVQDGALDLDRPVTAYWPEFPVESLTLRQLVSHQSGLIGVDGGFTSAELADDTVIAARLAEQKPFWEPGSAYGYHAFVIGALVGEVVRRTTGRRLQEIYDDRVRLPYGLDFYLGLPESEEPRYRPVQPALTRSEVDPQSLMGIAFNLHAPNPTDLVEFANTRRVRELGPASSGGVGNARGLAKMYAAAIGEIDGRPPLLTEATLAEVTRLHTPGTDLVTGEPDHFLLGFEAAGVRYPSLGRRAFGHSGAIGAQSFADPDSGLAYSYTRRRFSIGGAAPENDQLIATLVRALG
ncbi:MAG: beta-lactamase family protein [Hamadaea sp.]|uniref:serine hydrolase domain-containing protein n=1 Tax=Hamadaea sp. TaxID=2024425 RepID=UPI0017B373CF|nr:serine hydrolase domain-containing protein [Hamadaea sp.]NUR70446.1 beta-lactamase family protein [Hamadaea sp.]NUT20036.1 beta-lactamase family protein [Hamadaea sp.]